MSTPVGGPRARLGSGGLGSTRSSTAEIGSMHDNLQPGTRRGPAPRPEMVTTPRRETMETTRATERRRDRHARRLNQHALREAGSPTKVGNALDVSRTAVCHWTSDRVNPALREAFAVLLRLDAHPEVSGRAFAEAVAEAVELSEIVHAENDTLVKRGLYLMEWENQSDALEDQATLVGPASHSEALRRHGAAVMELAAILDELLYRGIDLHACYRKARAES